MKDRKVAATERLIAAARKLSRLAGHRYTCMHQEPTSACICGVSTAKAEIFGALLTLDPGGKA